MFPLNSMGVVQVVKDDEGVIPLGNGILLNDECVLTSLEAMLERIEETNLIPEKLMFKYENNYIFIHKIHKLQNTNEISTIMETDCFKPFTQQNSSSIHNPRFAILELENKISNAISIPKLPMNVMDIFSSKKEYLFEMNLYTIMNDKDYFVEIKSIARIKEDMTIEFEKDSRINNIIYNGSPLFVDLNGSMFLIGLYCYSKDSNSNSGKGYLVNYCSSIASNNFYQFEPRETMMTDDTRTETRQTVVK